MANGEIDKIINVKVQRSNGIEFINKCLNFGDVKSFTILKIIDLDYLKIHIEYIDNSSDTETMSIRESVKDIDNIILNNKLIKNQLVVKRNEYGVILERLNNRLISLEKEANIVKDIFISNQLDIKKEIPNIYSRMENDVYVVKKDIEKYCLDNINKEIESLELLLKTLIPFPKILRKYDIDTVDQLIRFKGENVIKTVFYKVREIHNELLPTITYNKGVYVIGMTLWEDAIKVKVSVEKDKFILHRDNGSELTLEVIKKIPKSML